MEPVTVQIDHVAVASVMEAIEIVSPVLARRVRSV